MKINGKKISGANEEILVLPRTDGDIVFRARAVLDTEEFDNYCPEPVAPMVMRRGGKRIEDLEDSKYLRLRAERNKKYIAYLVVKSLEATEGLEWETVKINDHNTWLNYSDELKKAGFSNVEVNRIVNCVFIANSLNEAKLEEAREHFLQGQYLNDITSGQKEELSTTLSGVPQNGVMSNHPE